MARPRKPGRRAVAPGGEVVNFRCGASEHLKGRKIAFERRISLSQVAREAFCEYVRRHTTGAGMGQPNVSDPGEPAVEEENVEEGLDNTDPIA